MAEGTHAWLPMLCRLPALRPHDTPSLRSFVCLLVCGAGRALLICMGLFLPMPVGPPSISPPVCLVALIVFSPALWATRGPVIVLFDSERCKASQPAGHRQCCRARPGVEMHSVCTMDWMGCCSSPVSVCQLPGTRQALACPFSWSHSSCRRCGSSCATLDGVVIVNEVTEVVAACFQGQQVCEGGFLGDQVCHSTLPALCHACCRSGALRLRAAPHVPERPVRQGAMAWSRLWRPAVQWEQLC